MFKIRYFATFLLLLLSLAVSSCEFRDPLSEPEEEPQEIKEVSVTETLDIGGTEVEVFAFYDAKGRVPRSWGMDVDEIAGIWVMIRLEASQKVDISQFKLTDWFGKKIYLPHEKSDLDKGLLLFKIPEGDEFDWDRHHPKLRFQAKDGPDHGFIIL